MDESNNQLTSLLITYFFLTKIQKPQMRQYTSNNADWNSICSRIVYAFFNT